MSGLFIRILNMSISASFVALIVMLIRISLKRIPKIYSYALWAVVFFRLICSFTIQLPVSAIPVQPETIPHDIIYAENPSIQSGVTTIDQPINHAIESSLPKFTPVRSMNPIQVVLEIGAYLWVIGILGLILYAIIGYLRLKRRLSTAIIIHDNIYETDCIQTPFVLGFLRTKIYVPTGLSESEMEYVIAHEQTHIRRFDYLIKPVAFLITVIHWFNPIVWVSYTLLIRDMELSADESVVKHCDIDIRSQYASSLLSLSIKKHGLFNPLAFGETGVKERVKNVLNYKKPAFWVSVIAIIVVVAVSIALTVSRQSGEKPSNSPHQGNISSSASTQTTEMVYTTNYNKVKITPDSKNITFTPNDAFETTDSRIVAYIDSMIREEMPPSPGDNLEDNNIERYQIEFSNEIGGYSCGLYYDTLYDKVYIVNDGGCVEAGVDFARYIRSFCENKELTFNMDKTDVALFQKYGWTLDYQISEVKSKLGNINTLFDFSPNEYYWSYNNELSKDIGLDMSQYANNTDIDVNTYRIHERMPEEIYMTRFYPAQDCRAIVVKNKGKIIGAFISAGRHNTFIACSLTGKSFETVTGQTYNEWLADNVKVSTEEKSLSTLEPQEIIKEYFTALSHKDEKRAQYCISREMQLGGMTSNIRNEELFNQGIYLPLMDLLIVDVQTGAKSNFDNLKSVELLKIEPIEDLSDDKNRKSFRVYMNIQHKKELSMSDGEQFWDCSMVYESLQTGWKIEGFGH